MIQVFHNKHVALPRALAKTDPDRIVDITDANSAQRCGRCGRAYGEHAWILVNTAYPEQNGVIDCAQAG